MATAGARARSSDVRADPRIARGERAGRARQQSVAKTKAAGGTPRSGTSFDLLDELEAEYERGARSVKRANEASRAANRRRGYSAGRADATRATPTPTSARAASTRSTAPAPAPTPVADPQLNAPNLSLGLGGGLDRTTAARIIVVTVALAGVGAVAHDAFVKGAPTKTTVKVGSETVTVPAHLHSLAGVVIVGTIALVVSEFSPQTGLALGLLLLIDVGVNIFAGGGGLSNRIARGIVNTPGASTPKLSGPAPSSSPKAGTAPGASAGAGGGGGGGGSW